MRTLLYHCYLWCNVVLLSTTEILVCSRTINLLLKTMILLFLTNINTHWSVSDDLGKLQWNTENTLVFHWAIVLAGGMNFCKESGQMLSRKECDAAGDALADWIVYVLTEKEGKIIVSLCSPFSYIAEYVCFDLSFPVFDTGSSVSLATQCVARAISQAK